MAAQTPSPPLPEWPDYGLIEDLLPTLADWNAQGHRAALATLIGIDGSSPRPLGSEMAISDTGDVAGYVSGGCVEAAVAQEALLSLADNRPRVLEYGAGSPVLDIQLTCGGRITLLVRPIPDLAAYVRARSSAHNSRTPLVVTTDIATGAMTFTAPSEAIASQAGRFSRRHEPPLRLVLAGGDPVTIALLHLARTIDIQTEILRPLGPQTPPHSVSPDHYDRRTLDTALKDLKLDRWTAVYALTHDGFTDLRIAEHALRSDAFCIGILGSRRKIAPRLDALRKQGFSETDLKRLRLPAGLDIHARTPMEIALSILAEIISLHRNRQSDA